MSNSGFPLPSASKMGRLIANPSGVAASGLETEMRTPGWWLMDMSPIEYGFPDERGESTLIPHAKGRDPNQSIVDETVYIMGFHVTGAVDASGNVPTGSNAALRQLRASRQHLLQNVAGPYDGSTTRVWKLIFTDGSSVLFRAKGKFDLVKQKGAEVDYVFSLKVPGGYV